MASGHLSAHSMASRDGLTTEAFPRSGLTYRGSTVRETGFSITGDLDGKVMLVTGGGGGVGREWVLADAREGGGIAVLDSQLDTAACGCLSGRSKHLLGACPHGEVIANA